MTKDRAPSASDPAATGSGLAAGVDLEALRITRADDSESSGTRRRSAPRWPLAVLALLLGAVVVAVLLRGPGSGNQSPAVSEAPPSDPAPPPSPAPSRYSRAAGFSAAGWVKLPLYHPVRVTPLIEGRVEEILVIEGSRVEKGQVLARLYRRDYEAQVDVAEAAVQAAQAAYDKMRAGYRKQETAEAGAEVDGLVAELATAEEILRHSRELGPSGAIPLEELQVDETKVQTLRARLAKARERLALFEEGYRTEDIALALATLEKTQAQRDLARLRLEYTEIKSPIDGVVLERKATRGQWLKPHSGEIADLYDPSDLEARVDVNQDDVSKVFLGQEVQVTTRAESGKVHPGKVVLIEPKADLVKNTVPVRVKLLEAGPGDLLHPDMVVTARFLFPKPAPKAPSDEPKPQAPEEPRR